MGTHIRHLCKANFACLGCRTEWPCGRDKGGKDALLDTCLAGGSMGIGSERICTVVVVCQRQAWRQVILKPTNTLGACFLSRFFGPS